MTSPRFPDSSQDVELSPSPGLDVTRGENAHGLELFQIAPDAPDLLLIERKRGEGMLPAVEVRPQ
jgi:hypothetical protein